MISDIIDAARARMQTAVNSFESELQNLHGPASASMFDGIKVDYYGTPTPVSQLATVTVVDPTMVVVKPYDQSMVEPIYNAIRTSIVGSSPEMDSELVRVSISAPEDPEELVKFVNKLASPARIAVRAAQTDALDMLAKAEISADERTNGEKMLGELTDGFIFTIDKLTKAKANELMQATGG
jgi:ribosome recycling factor